MAYCRYVGEWTGGDCDCCGARRFDCKTDKAVIVNIGKTDAIMPTREQLPGEYYKPGNRIRVFVLDVKETSKLPQVIVSQAHAEIVRELFELEVPEIVSGDVKIKNIVREAGYRTKIAVYSTNPNIDPVGSCVGNKGARVNAIVNELNGEKIDIVPYSTEPELFISSALSPATVLHVSCNVIEKTSLAVVPDDKLSLAIGKSGQNVRLAAKLTNWKIDIKSESQFREMIMAMQNEETTEESVESEE